MSEELVIARPVFCFHNRGEINTQMADERSSPQLPLRARLPFRQALPGRREGPAFGAVLNKRGLRDYDSEG